MKKRMKEIVEKSYELLIHKINYGNINVDNEAGFQLQFAYILKCLGQLYEFSPNERFTVELEKKIELSDKTVKNNTNKAKIDIFLKLEDEDTSCKCAIELKYFKRENHREPNNRYDVFSDISNLEMYKSDGIDVCYFIMGTDHIHYVDQRRYSDDTKDFDFRDRSKYIKNTKLSYRTQKPYGEDIVLRNSYEFKWDKFVELYFLKVEI